MIRVHVVRRENRQLYAELIDKNHRLRFSIFCLELGWKDLISDGDSEYDQFDTPNTVHLIVEEDGLPIGGCRLHPSTEPTLLSDVFPQLAAIKGFERRADILEMTRGYVARHRREERPCRVAGAWKAAALEYCLAEAITSFNGVWGTYLIPGISQLGWRPRFLGLPETIDGFDLVAANIEATEDALYRTWSHFGFQGPVTVWRGIKPKLPLARAAIAA